MLRSAKGHTKESFKKEKELCSIIMPAYNSAKYIAEAIESVIKQTYINWELIIVNDNSTDDTEKIIKEYQQKDERIKLISFSQNKGAANARNTAMQNAKGKYIAFLDSDDYWEKEKLQTQIKVLEATKANLIYTAYNMIDSENNLIKVREIKDSVSLKDLLKENSIIFSSVLCRSESIANKQFTSAWYHEDYVYLLSMLKDGQKFTGINKILVNYRVHQSGRSFNKVKAAQYRWKIYRDYLKMNILKSAYYFCTYAVNGIKKYK